MKMMVLNLPRTMDEAHLAQLFQAYGAVKSCTIVIDTLKQTSKGFGFVEMPNQDEAMVAIATLHGKKIEKQRLRVKRVENNE